MKVQQAHQDQHKRVSELVKRSKIEELADRFVVTLLNKLVEKAVPYVEITFKEKPDWANSLKEKVFVISVTDNSVEVLFGNIQRFIMLNNISYVTHVN